MKSNWVILGSQGSSKICTPMVPHTPITKPGFIKYRPEMQNDKLLVILFFCKANNTNLCSQCENFRIFLSLRFYRNSILNINSKTAIFQFQRLQILFLTFSPKELKKKKTIFGTLVTPKIDLM